MSKLEEILKMLQELSSDTQLTKFKRQTWDVYIKLRDYLNYGEFEKHYILISEIEKIISIYKPMVGRIDEDGLALEGIMEMLENRTNKEEAG